MEEKRIFINTGIKRYSKSEHVATLIDQSTTVIFF